jgi:hypothetical protein
MLLLSDCRQSRQATYILKIIILRYDIHPMHKKLTFYAKVDFFMLLDGALQEFFYHIQVKNYTERTRKGNKALIAPNSEYNL